MNTANRLRRFRTLRDITQEDLAVRWGVSVRTIARWERGEGRPAEWMRRELAAVENPLDWPNVSVLSHLIQNHNGPGMILDSTLKVVAGTSVHKRWMRQVYGLDIEGIDWHKYTGQEALDMFEHFGGVPYMIKNGLMCIRGFYSDPGGVDGTEMPKLQFVDLTIVRIPDYGNLCVSVSRDPRPDEPHEFITPHFLD